MLQLDHIDAYYGDRQALFQFSLDLSAGEVLCLLGRNGAGKTTALKTIMGLVTTRSGSILFKEHELNGRASHEIPRLGIGYVPQGRRLFSEMSVRENLEIGLMTRHSDAATLERVLTLFPRLQERLTQRSGTLSGGEQQMLAMARALCTEPQVLLLDEPTEGLMPAMIATIREVIIHLRDQGVGILLVEQRVDAVIPVANRVAFIENGRVRETVPVENITGDYRLLHKYVGVGS